MGHNDYSLDNSDVDDNILMKKWVTVKMCDVESNGLTQTCHHKYITDIGLELL